MLPDLKKMTKEEKFITMRNLWEDMRESVSNSPESPEIIELLNRRAARIESGEAELFDWDKVKGSIGRS
jgi:hypothetical protein